jgi:hypothetical protein
MNAIVGTVAEVGTAGRMEVRLTLHYFVLHLPLLIEILTTDRYGANHIFPAFSP